MKSISSNSLSIVLKGVWNHCLHVLLQDTTELSTDIHCGSPRDQKFFIYAMILSNVSTVLSQWIAEKYFCSCRDTRGCQKGHWEMSAFELLTYVLTANVWVNCQVKASPPGLVRDYFCVWEGWGEKDKRWSWGKWWTLHWRHYLRAQ